MDKQDIIATVVSGARLGMYDGLIVQHLRREQQQISDAPQEGALRYAVGDPDDRGYCYPVEGWVYLPGVEYGLNEAEQMARCLYPGKTVGANHLQWFRGGQWVD